MKEEPLNNDELQLFNRRDFIVKGILSVPLTAIIWRLWDLQIKQGEKFKDLSKGNRVRINSVPAPRGLIYDRTGTIFSKNIPSFNLMLVREDCEDVPTTLIKLAEVLKIPLKLLNANLKKFGKVQKFQSIQLYKDLTWYQMALVSAYQEEFSGINIEVSPRRFFPVTESGAHLMGYMSKISKKQLQNLPQSKIMSARIIGQDGVEGYYNSDLIGTDGGEQVEVNSRGRVIQVMDSIEPTPGKDMVLNIDAKLQSKVEEILGDRKGSCILMNPNSGEVFCMASKPSFNPNEFSQGLSAKRWKEMSNNPDHPLNNKGVQGVYSPGSTFKMAVAAAALELGIIDSHTKHTCEGAYKYQNFTIHCWNRHGHGALNVTQALERSCNIFFYKLGMEIGVDRIKEYANRMGLGLPTGVDLMHEKVGVMPSKAWKKKRFNQIWYVGETLPVSIGQGYVTSTPLQLLTYINCIATEGKKVQPRIVKQVLEKSSDLESVLRSPAADPVFEPVGFQQRTWDILKEGMRKNVQGAGGTGRSARSYAVDIDMAGKTGTTQVVSHKTRTRLRAQNKMEERFFNHAWFVSFAP
ncbi:MAG: penicillin-binding protein 2, partial [SAR324 cluster bacterium]|nr:penicillin-binding protein 2 [SAR324 cluster bacterium]